MIKDMENETPINNAELSANNENPSNPPKKSSHVAFWILFPIGWVLLAAISFVYLDFANGHVVWLSVMFLNLVGLAVSSILLLRRRVPWRLIPWGAFLIVTSMVVGMAKPGVAIFPAVTHANPEYTASLTIKNGDIRGVYSEDKKVEVYAGIPFAKPPVGEYRWKAPQPVDNWEGVRDCDFFGPRSMQPGENSIIDSAVDIYAQRAWYPTLISEPVQNMSEDSLYLNVWKPAGDVHDLPVLVFIHGGSLTSGSSAHYAYNGETMAHNGVIMVTIQYRLGVFGYFAHEDLLKESAEAGEATTGNYGLLDQIQALKWVQENIGAFGGDKDKVTVAGESAGSSSVSALCVSPKAKGLFRYAIGESSSLVVKKAPHTFRKLDEAKETGAKIMSEFGCSSIAELRNVPADKLVKTKHANSGMTIDGAAIVEEPYKTYQDGNNNETALLNGYNTMEADAFVVPQFLFNPTNKDNIESRLIDAFGEEYAKRLMNTDRLKKRIEEDAFAAFNEVYSVYWFIQPHDSWSKMALANGEPVYRYHFTKDNGYYRSYHSGEMVYCYGNIDRSSKTFAYNDTDRALSKTMVSYWANFVKKR